MTSLAMGVGALVRGLVFVGRKLEVTGAKMVTRLLGNMLKFGNVLKLK